MPDADTGFHAEVTGAASDIGFEIGLDLAGATLGLIVEDGSALVHLEVDVGLGGLAGEPGDDGRVSFAELGDAFQDGRVHLRLRSYYNSELIGDPEAGPEMHFSFLDLLEHIAKTRAFGAGTILGSGTVSNADRARGVSCLAERRMIETIDEGAAKTPFMKPGESLPFSFASA